MDNHANNQPQENGGGNDKFPKNQLMVVLLAAFITFGIAGFMRTYMADKSQQEISYDAFIKEVEQGRVESVTVRNNQIDIRYQENSEKFNPP